ncbi:MAG: diguanylate cyclase [Thiovulaceae bacterium]|nr:diguanylate cyclase [Sulfurimonadaceae bacterium]
MLRELAMIFFEKIEISKILKWSTFVMAFLVVLSFLNLFFLVTQQKQYAQLINLSGKQRMLSEKIHSSLYQILFTPSQMGYREFEMNLALMKHDYLFLKKSLDKLEFKEQNIYTSGYKTSPLRVIYESKALLKYPIDPKEIHEILDHREEILADLNLPVDQLQHKSDELSQETINRGVLLLVLVLLGIISVLIFYPLLQYLKIKNQKTLQLNSELEDKVARRTKRLNEMLDIVNQYVYSTHTDKNGVITYVTDAFCELSGYSREELLGKTHSLIKHPDNSSSVFAPLWKTILSGNPYHDIVKNKHKNGTDYWLESYIVPDLDDNGTIIGFGAFRQNITDKMQLKELNDELEKRVVERTAEIERIAVTDALTGLFNRHRFNEELTDALAFYKRYQAPIALAIFDIDYFKKINDTYGHNTGDKVLVTFAELLKQNMRQTDKLARWGGEEFVILFMNTEINGACLAAQNLLDIIRNHLFEEVGVVTCSIGLAALTLLDTPESLLQHADSALYLAKEGGRNQVQVFED